MRSFQGKSPGSKKSNRKVDRNQKEVIERRRFRSSRQSNRFTNVLDLPDYSSQMLQNLFGSLVFDFSRNPVVVIISDATGNYELQVAKESLDEFKMRVLLGQNQRLKPTFSIFLGECQCYPELPEGPLLGEPQEMVDEVPADSSQTSVQNVSAPAVSDEGGNQFGPQDVISPESVHDELEVIKSSMIQVPSPRVNVSSGDDTVSGANNENSADLTSRATTTCQESSLNHGRGDAAPSPDETPSMVLSKTTPTSSGKVKKFRSFEKLLDGVQKASKLGKKHSSGSGGSLYKSNLEGFIQFLMNDEICSSALKKDGSSKSHRRIVGGQNVIKYSDGREYVITYEEKDGDKTEKVTPREAAQKLDCLPNSNTASTSSIPSLKDQVLSELSDNPKKFDSNVFVQEIKRELAKWEAKCKQPVDVEIVNGDDGKATESNADTLTEEMKTVRKAEESSSSSASDASGESLKDDSLEQFFFGLNESEEAEEGRTSHSPPLDRRHQVVQSENHGTLAEEPQNVGESADLGLARGDARECGHPIDARECGHPVDGGVRSDVFREITTEPVYEKGGGVPPAASYVPPIPLESTSNSEIEAMWMSFVKRFHPKGLDSAGSPKWDQNGEDVKKQKESSPIRCPPSSPRVPPHVVPPRNEEGAKASQDAAYPGQHCYPYFVEASLRRVNTMLETLRASHPPSNGGGESPRFISSAVPYPYSPSTVFSPTPMVEFTSAVFSPPAVEFPSAVFSPPVVDFPSTAFSPPTADFPSAGFSPPTVDFSSAGFSPPMIDLPPGDHTSSRPPSHCPPLTYHERFSSRRCRIFFNPNVPVGDWYQN